VPVANARAKRPALWGFAIDDSVTESRFGEVAEQSPGPTT
jgi:hypothetical protein